MAIISTREELLEKLQDIHALEISARDRYMQDTITFRNFLITDTIKKIKLEEDKHIKILSELIAYLKRKS